MRKEKSNNHRRRAVATIVEPQQSCGINEDAVGRSSLSSRIHLRSMYRRRQLTNQLLVTRMKGILYCMRVYVHVHNYTSHFPTSFHLWNLMIRDSSRRFRVLGYSLLPRHRSFDFLPVALYLSSCYSRSKLIRALSRYRRNNETSRRFIVLLPHQNHRIKDSCVRTR